jgi:hypothetical protein
MSIRGQQKISTVTILPGLALDLNPFSTRLGAGRVLRNWIPERGRLARKTFSPQFTVKPDTAGGDVWHVRNFRYTRAGAPENRVLIFREDGRLYQRQSTYEQELWPSGAATSVSGPLSDATGSDLGASWTNPTNIGSSNDARATASIVTTGIKTTTSGLLADNLGFAIASTNSIQGIYVLVEAQADAGAYFQVQLRKGGVAVGNLVDMVGFGVTDTEVFAGSSTDLWGTSWSPSDINAADFGIVVNGKVPTGPVGTFNVAVDYIAVYVFYGASASIGLVKKPFAQQLSNRFFFNDGVSKKVYDGRDVQNWGFDRTTTAPTVTAQNLAGSIVAATGVKGCITWVKLDEEGNRVHESSRTNLSGFVVIGGADDSVRLDITALTPPTRATHWSAYISELDGSEVLRRAATTAISTLTVDITAFPASTAPKAPIRNDPPPPSSVGWVAKNRIFLRDDNNQATFWFSALGEVKGLLNGAAEESFCGYGTNSISEISNSDFVPDREIKGGIEHDNFVFVWSEKYGYALIGEFNLLDNRSPRGIRKERVFSESLAGADAAASTPYGLAWMNPGRKVLLWTGGASLTPISEPIQTTLDTIPNSEIANVYLGWWSGNGRQWLILTCRCSSKDDDADSGLANRTFVYDFSRPSQRTDGEVDPGTWLEWTDLSATCVGFYYDEQGSPFLLLGTTNSDVRLVDSVCNPTHLNYTAILGKTYFGATVQSNPRCVLRTGLILPSGDSWTVANYIQLITGDQTGPGTPSLGSLTEPTIASAIDIKNPDLLGTGISLTLDTATTAGDKRAWLVPQVSGAGNNVNIGGAFGKQFVFQFSYAAGNDSTGEADGRLSTRQNTVYKAALTFEPEKEMAR